MKKSEKVDEPAVAYQRRLESALEPLAVRLNALIQDYVGHEPRIDRITTRAKSLDRFLAKARTTVNGAPKYSEPLSQIQDQIGSRIVTFYLSDVLRISNLVEKYFRPIESQSVIPESQWEFGYFGKHYVLIIPTDVLDKGIDPELVPKFFELQVKTLHQHAWSEANHDLGYKPELASLSADDNRKLAFASAQAWSADLIFDQLWQSVQARSKTM